MKIDAATAKLLAERFPKFTKIQKCMVNNPEYGLGLSEEAIEYLQERTNRSPSSTKRTPVRKKQNRMAVRLDDDDYKLVCAAMEAAGNLSAQEFLESLIKNNVTKGDTNNDD